MTPCFYPFQNRGYFFVGSRSKYTHASLLLRQAVHLKIVQERLGHSSIQVTLDTYSHVAPVLQEAAAKRFDDIINLHHSPVDK
jgi:integrase